MTATQFKELWSSTNTILNDWATFDVNEIESRSLSNPTKGFLKVGFPRQAAPYLSFGDYRGQLPTVAEIFGTEYEGTHTSYIVFGSDNVGNPICFDTTKNDRIVLLDHEDNLGVIDIINHSIDELAQCLLTYSSFINKIQVENGNEAYLDFNFSDDQFIWLEEQFKCISPNIFKDSPFWKNELRSLKASRS